MTNKAAGQLAVNFAKTTIVYADNPFEKKALERTLERIGADNIRVELREPRYTYGC